MSFLNATLQTIYNRYSCRAYTAEIPSDAHIREIAEAAITAPSAMNLQPWHVVVVQKRELIKQMELEGLRVLSKLEDKTAYKQVMAGGGTLFYNAPVLFMIAGDAASHNTALDCGIVTQNITLAAASLGLGSVICGMAGLAFSPELGEELRHKLGYPEGYKHQMAVAVGFPKEPKAPHEPDMSKITYVV